MVGPNKDGKRQHNRKALPEDEIATHSKNLKKIHLPKELEDEVKRHNLLRQRDWFTTYKTGYNRPSAPYERTRIGKRRKLKQDDLARTAVQYKLPINRPNLSFSVSGGVFKPSQVSVRLGSQIHGTQGTTLSGSKAQVEATAASGMATEESENPLTVSRRSLPVLKETPISGIPNFEALEEMTTPPQHVSLPSTKDFKIERWISKSALKRRRTGSSRIGEMTTDESMSRSPKSLDGEAGSSETVFERRRKILDEDSGSQSRKKRSTENQQTMEIHYSTQFPLNLASIHDEIGVCSIEENKPTGRQAEFEIQETCNSVITEAGNTRTEGWSVTSIPRGSEAIGTETVASLVSKSISSCSLSDSKLMFSSDKVHVRLDSQKHETAAPDERSVNSQRPKELSSLHSLTASSYTDSPTKERVGNNATNYPILERPSLGLSGAPRTLAQRQNDDWFNWIVSLNREPAEDGKSNSIKIPKLQTSTTPVAQPIQSINPTPASLRSTYVNIGSTPNPKPHVEDPQYPSELNLWSTSDHSHIESPVTEGNNIHIHPHTLDNNFETPIAQQSLDIPQPDTPGKPLVQRRSISREGNGLDPKAINLREKFLQVAGLPVNIQSKPSKERNPTDDGPGVLLTTYHNSVNTSKKIKIGKAACVIVQNDSVPLTKSVSRSIVFVKPQRFEIASPGKKMKIGQAIPVQSETWTDPSFVAHADKGDFERDEIED